MVGAARKALERLYMGRCDVIARRGVRDDVTKITEQQEVTLLEGIPCRLSFKGVVAAGEAAPVAPVVQTVKLFLAPEVQIPVGSKLVVTQNGVTAAYTRSGKPAVYATHQEILLELFEGWA